MEIEQHYPDTMPQPFWFDNGEALVRGGYLEDDNELQRLGLENMCRVLRGTMLKQWGPLDVRQIDQKDAREFIEANHRHHPAPRGWKFGAAIGDLVSVVGVITVGRPTARKLDDGTVLEVTRLCLLNGCVKNVPSMLYGKAARIAKELGYRSIITYTLEEEDGASLTASGWQLEGAFGGGSWSRKSRPRVDNAPTTTKRRWRKQLVQED